MDVNVALSLLGGLSPAQFMRLHWQKKPLWVRQAWQGVRPPVGRAELMALAGRDEVESRLVVRTEGGWSLRHGPLSRRSIPPYRQPDWTLLVQGLDLHAQAAHDMLRSFRFVPDARLDDLMMSYASDGGGVGPHLDSYDVFLLQVHGRRRWRIAPPGDATLQEGLPLKILKHFVPTQEQVLEPGDMLYLPPGWGHDGVAEGECMTCSIGFRAQTRAELAADLLARLADDAHAAGRAMATRYQDRRQAATGEPGRIPPALQGFALRAVQAMCSQPDRIDDVLGQSLTEPKPRVWFEPGPALSAGQGVRLDPGTRMMYDDRHLYINGESFSASGEDAQLMRELANQRCLEDSRVGRLSPQARVWLADWVDHGWVHAAAADF